MCGSETGNLGCVSAHPGKDEQALRNDLLFAKRDRYSFSSGHLLMIPFRYVQSNLETTSEENLGLLEMIEMNRVLP